MNLNDLRERLNVALLARSPIHIGSLEQRITPFEFIQKGAQVYHVSDERLSEFLGEKGLIEPYVREVASQGHTFRLAPFFNKMGVNLSGEDLLRLSAGRKATILGDVGNIQEYRPLIRDGLGSVYIPGSSIKGSMRTAVLYRVLKNMQAADSAGFQRSIEDVIEKTDDKAFKRRDPFIWIQNHWLEGFRINDKHQSPNTDWLRMLQVRDGYPVNLKETALLPLRILKKEGRGWAMKKEGPNQDTILWVETIPVGVYVEFEMVWDHGLLKEFKRQNPYAAGLPETPNNVLGAAVELGKDVVAFEKGFSKGSALEAWYSKNSPNFRVGFGSGMLSTTIALLLPPSMRTRVRNLAGKDEGEAEAPKSRRVWMDNGQAIPMGWTAVNLKKKDPQ